MKKSISIILAVSWLGFLCAACATGRAPSETSANEPANAVEEAARVSAGSYKAYDGDALLAVSERAVAELADSVSGLLPQGAGVLVASFVDAGNLNETTPLGRLLAAQFATGLTGAGYMVKESRLRADLALRPGQGEFALSREAAVLAHKSFAVSAVLYGFYVVDRDAVYVSARVALTGDGAVAAAADYALLNRRAVTRMLGSGQDLLFERFVRGPSRFRQASAGGGGLEESDLAEAAPEQNEPAFRIFPPTRLNP